jgi:uncharacterized protein (TIGR03437 family)
VPAAKAISRTVFALTLVLCLTPALQAQHDRIHGPIDASTTVVLDSRVAPLALAQRGDEGAVDASRQLPWITMMFQRAPEQQGELTRLLAEQQNPSSPNYHKWLSAEEFADRFGLSTNDVGRIASWLRDQGFRVAYVARDRDFIAFSGSAGQVRDTFHTGIHRYTVDGEAHIMNQTAPSVPAALADVVLGIEGLNDFALKPGITSGGGGHDLAPSDIATIYDLAPLYNEGFDGSGQSMVVLGQSNVNLSDLHTFRTNYNLPGSDPQLVPCCNPPGTTGDINEVEADLDLEWASGVATNASIIYVYAANALLGAQYAIDQDLAPVVSLSFGVCEPSAASQGVTFNAWEGIAQAGNAKGITWLANAGDAGAAACDLGATVASHGLAVNFPASIPEVTAVGGTEFNEGAGSYWSSTATNGASALSYIPEIAWNDSDTPTEPQLAATGGGASTVFSKPSWQTGPGVPNDGMRDLPDLSVTASAAHDPYNIYTIDTSTGTSGWFVYGGTSASTPVVASMVVLLNQSLAAAGKPVAGNINSTLYSLAQASSVPFHDITAGNNIVPCTAGSPDCVNGFEGYSAGPGFNLVTGLGSIDAFNLVTVWDGGMIVKTVENAEGGGAAIAPNTWMEIDGANLAPATNTPIAPYPNDQMPTQWDQVSVTVNGKPAYMYYVSARQINVLTPPDAMEGPVEVQVTNNGVASTPFTVQAQAEAPSFFAWYGQNGLYVAAEHGNNSFVGPPNLFPGGAPTTPAVPGEEVALFANGFGATSVPLVAGSSNQLGNLPVFPVITIGNLPATVKFAGEIGYAGVYQINVVVPMGAANGDNPVVATYGGFTSDPVMLLTVQQ